MTPALTTQQQTLSRLSALQSRFTSHPGSGRLSQKVCILTGVGSPKGIGRATAVAFAREGAKHLYVSDIVPSDLVAFAEGLRKRYEGTEVTVLIGDAASEVCVREWCERAVREEGRLDVFFANAGIVGAHMLQNSGEDEFMKVMRVNSLSCFLAVKHASEAMKVVSAKRHEQGGKAESGGSIILTASVAGMRSGAGPQDYSASKAAVINLAQTSAQVLSGTAIRVNAVLPGLIETGMTTATFERAKERGTLGKVGQLNPLRRFGVAEEIAGAVLFLASDDSSYVNGTQLVVDGGLSSSHPIVPGQYH